MSTTGNTQDSVRDFFDWRYHAREFYENISMVVLPEHQVSLHFTKETVCAGDSFVYGIVMGTYNIREKKSSVSLYNVYFPNRSSLQFNKEEPNPDWGKLKPVSSFTYEGQIYATSVNSRNDIMAAIDNKLVYIGESSDTTIDMGQDAVSMVQFIPDFNDSDSRSETSAYVVTNTHIKNRVMYLNSPEAKPSLLANFTRPVTDISIDPIQNSSILVTQGKRNMINIDRRSPGKTKINSKSYISSISYAPNFSFMFAAGSLSGTIGIYDFRFPSAPICTMTAHDSEVTSLIWSPHDKDIVASSSMDAAIALWSVTEGNEPDPTAVFAHNGHITPITAFDWCKDIPWTLASISEDNLFEIWTIAPSQIEDYYYPESPEH